MQTAVQRGHLSVVLNRESGTLRKVGAAQVESRLHAIFAASGCTATIRSVGARDLAAALEDARAAPGDAVIVGGGDGSVAAAATVFAGHSIPLGILPLGTFNLAARDVGAPVDWEQAAALMATAPVVETDLLKVADRLFLCVVVLGFYPSLAMRRPEHHGNWVMKTLSTLFKTLFHAATYPPLELRLHDGTTERRFRTRIVLLANNDYEDMFGIIPARRSLDAGFFTVYISNHTTQLGLLKSALRWLIGRWKSDREITALRSTELWIDVKHKPSVSVMMDGELAKIAVPFSVKLVPKALRVIAPRLLEKTNEQR